MKNRRNPQVSLLIKRAAEFFAGLAEGCKVDDAKARDIWSDFAKGMNLNERVDFLLNGRAAGLEIAKHIKVEADGTFAIKYEAA